MIKRKPQDPALDPLNVPLEEKRRRNAAMLKLINEWMADESGYDEEMLPLLEKGLDENRRISGDYRKLFGEEGEGQ
jgi:hypothetical protein